MVESEPLSKRAGVFDGFEQPLRLHREAPRRNRAPSLQCRTVTPRGRGSIATRCHGRWHRVLRKSPRRSCAAVSSGATVCPLKATSPEMADGPGAGRLRLDNTAERCPLGVVICRRDFNRRSRPEQARIPECPERSSKDRDRLPRQVPVPRRCARYAVRFACCAGSRGESRRSRRPTAIRGIVSRSGSTTRWRESPVQDVDLCGLGLVAERGGAEPPG